MCHLHSLATHRYNGKLDAPFLGGDEETMGKETDNLSDSSRTMSWAWPDVSREIIIAVGAAPQRGRTTVPLTRTLQTTKRRSSMPKVLLAAQIR